MKYTPFGEEETATEENRIKFGIYVRDEVSGLDRDNSMRIQILKNVSLHILITVVVAVLFILNSNTICAQSDTIELNKGSNNTKGTIVGRVLGITQNATAQLYDPVLRKIQMSVNINESGNYSFEEITPGEYVINISSPSYMDHPVAVSVKEGMNIIEEQLLEYYYIGGGSIGFPVNKPAGVRQPSAEYLKRKAAFDKYPEVSGYKILTVCELLSIESFRWIHSVPIVIIGNLVQTPEGSWLEQSCGRLLKSGTHSWPDAIFLNKDSSTSNRLTFILEAAGNNLGEDFIQNNSSDDSILVAVAGRLIVGDNLVYVKCGEAKTCGFGYGPIAAPIQMDYEFMRYLNQQDTYTE